MTVKDLIDLVIKEGKEKFLPARDESHANSMRVMAFNYRRQAPAVLQDMIGIQKVFENNKWFLRIFLRDFEDTTLWVRDETGKLVPEVGVNPEILRMIELMRKDGKTEEEINKLLQTEEKHD